MKIEIEKTADGSPTLYREDIDEHYHSVKGALTESSHVYIDLGWRKASSQFYPVRVFEVGFGTGLNAALTAGAAAEAAIPTEYYSIELYPIPNDTIAAILPSLPMDIRTEFKAVNDASWEVATKINPYFTLIKINGSIHETPLPQEINTVYFDAFAPEKQPEMWEQAIFRKIYDCMSAGGVLTTYCAKGRIRRMLGDLGFLTERLPGPPAGKREVLRATKQ